MKKILFILLLVPLITALDCGGGEPEPSQEELAKRSWKVEKVFVNGSEINASNYKMSFSDNSFSITAPDLDDPDFPSSGTWKFNSNKSKIILNDTIEMTKIKLDEMEFILEYEYSNFKQGTVTFRFEMVPAT